MRGLMALYTFWFTLLRISADSCVGLLIFPLPACAIYYFRILTSYVFRVFPAYRHKFGGALLRFRDKPFGYECDRQALRKFANIWNNVVQVSWLDIIPRMTMRE